MPKFTISLAMNIRAYGFVEVEADDIETAKSQITADKLRNEFQPHGAGDDDFDYSHPTQVYLSDYSMDGGEYLDLCIDLPDPLPGF